MSLHPVTWSVLVRGGLAAAAGALLLGAVAGPASAAPGLKSSGMTTANVVVQSAIALTGLTDSFIITGVPGGTQELVGAATYRVATNNFAGYAVAVQAEAATLAPVRPTNTDSIPIANLKVRETGTTAYTSVSNVTPVTVHTQGTRSAATGDALSTDYSVDIPFVNEDTYKVTLDYVATTL